MAVIASLRRERLTRALMLGLIFGLVACPPCHGQPLRNRFCPHDLRPNSAVHVPHVPLVPRLPLVLAPPLVFGPPLVLAPPLVLPSITTWLGIRPG